MRTKAPLAVLSMYDWPEVRLATDALWIELREACRRRGLPAPDTLARKTPEAADQADDDWALKRWLNPDLLLAQTCGLPFARFLKGKVRLLGSPAYAIEDCDAGDYYSVVIAGRSNGLKCLDDIDQRHRFAFNNCVSQSGFRAMQKTLENQGRSSNWLRDGVESGSHRQSVGLVADGAADFAVIDAVSWLLATRHEAKASAVMKIGTTMMTPGLPMICSMGQDPDLVGGAIEEAVSLLASSPANALGLTGFRKRPESDYAQFSEEH